MHNHTHYDRNVETKKENLDTSSHHIQGITVRMTAGVCSETVEAKDSALTLKVLKGVYQQPRILYFKKKICLSKVKVK